MAPPRRKQKELDEEVPMNVDESDTDEDETKEESSSPSCTVATNATSAGANSAKLKCLKCFRAARKDCTGKLCIRCCTDENCTAHQELRAKARWKEDVMAGNTEIQRKAKHKRSRAIPKGRFRERTFKYMHDTVVLWDLRTVLDPSLPKPQQQQTSPVDHSPTKEKRESTAASIHTTSSSTATASVSAAAMAQYQSDLKVKDEILRRSRKNNQSSLQVKTQLRRNYQGTRKRFRSVMETMYQQSLD